MNPVVYYQYTIGRSRDVRGREQIIFDHWQANHRNFAHFEWDQSFTVPAPRSSQAPSSEDFISDNGFKFEGDRYTFKEGTRHVVGYNEKGEIESGCRLVATESRSFLEPPRSKDNKGKQQWRRVELITSTNLLPFENEEDSRGWITNMPKHIHRKKILEALQDAYENKKITLEQCRPLRHASFSIHASGRISAGIWVRLERLAKDLVKNGEIDPEIHQGVFLLHSPIPETPLVKMIERGSADNDEAASRMFWIAMELARRDGVKTLFFLTHPHVAERGAFAKRGVPIRLVGEKVDLRTRQQREEGKPPDLVCVARVDVMPSYINLLQECAGMKAMRFERSNSHGFNLNRSVDPMQGVHKIYMIPQERSQIQPTNEFSAPNLPSKLASPAPVSRYKQPPLLKIPRGRAQFGAAARSRITTPPTAILTGKTRRDRDRIAPRSFPRFDSGLSLTISICYCLFTFTASLG